MRNLTIVLALMMPVFSFAQKFEISEQAGYGGAIIGSDFPDGFSNQVAVKYHPIKYLAVGAYYEYNSWYVKCHNFGIAPEFNTKHFFAGIDLFVLTVKKYSWEYFDVVTTNKYSPTFGYGAHIGARQKIYKGLSLIEQVGYSTMYMNWKVDQNPKQLLYPGSSYSDVYSEKIGFLYIRGGVSYRL